VLLEVKDRPETADSILLYALDKPTFVVDAYTFRILSRHHLVPESCTYEELRRVFMDHLPADLGLYRRPRLLVRLKILSPQPNVRTATGWPDKFDFYVRVSREEGSLGASGYIIRRHPALLSLKPNPKPLARGLLP
jgi:hypothetical protein